MTIHVAGNDTKELAPQVQPEVIYSPEIAQTSSSTTQAGSLTVVSDEILFDLSLLEEMDDDEYVADILTIFLGDTPKEFNDLKKACFLNKCDDVYKMAHKIKGSAGLLQANFLLNRLIKIEEIAKAGKSDELVKLAELANEEYKKIEIPLKAHLRNIEKKLR
jgi:HPt (histidine-containing phosphotransfer) domain-containing protein